MQTNLTLSAPFNRAVYQRDNSGSGRVPVAGTAPAGTASVTVIFSPIVKIEPAAIGAKPVVASVNTLANITVDANGNFSDYVTVPGGWYGLTVSAGTQQATLQRVGVGEVFIVFGHSFMDGGRGDYATTEEQSVSTLDALGNERFEFGTIGAKIGPMGNTSPTWRLLADKMVRRLGVPVLMYGAAYGGSNIQQNYDVLTNAPDPQHPPGWNATDPRQPLHPLEAVLSAYTPKTGVRAILMEHGYNDRAIDTATFTAKLHAVVDYIRNTYGMPKMAIVAVQEEISQQPGTLAAPDTAKGLQAFIASYPDVFAGPDFNSGYWSNIGLRESDAHLSALGNIQFANDWDACLSDGLLQRITPYGSNYLKPLSSNLMTTALYAPTPTLNWVDYLLLIVAAGLLVLMFSKPARPLQLAFVVVVVAILFRLK